MAVLFPRGTGALLEPHQDVPDGGVPAHDGPQGFLQGVVPGPIGCHQVAPGGDLQVPVEFEGVVAVGAEIGCVDAQDHQLVGHVGPAVPLEGFAPGPLFGRRIGVLDLPSKAFLSGGVHPKRTVFRLLFRGADEKRVRLGRRRVVLLPLGQRGAGRQQKEQQKEERHGSFPADHGRSLPSLFGCILPYRFNFFSVFDVCL